MFTVDAAGLIRVWEDEQIEDKQVQSPCGNSNVYALFDLSLTVYCGGPLLLCV